MRIRIIKGIASKYGSFSAGDVTNVPDKAGAEWCRLGVAMQDKSHNGGTETKAKKVKHKAKR